MLLCNKNFQSLLDTCINSKWKCHTKFGVPLILYAKYCAHLLMLAIKMSLSLVPWLLSLILLAWNTCIANISLCETLMIHLSPIAIVLIVAWGWASILSWYGKENNGRKMTTIVKMNYKVVEFLFFSFISSTLNYMIVFIFSVYMCGTTKHSLNLIWNMLLWHCDYQLEFCEFKSKKKHHDHKQTRN